MVAPKIGAVIRMTGWKTPSGELEVYANVSKKCIPAKNLFRSKDAFCQDVNSAVKSYSNPRFSHEPNVPQCLREWKKLQDDSGCGGPPNGTPVRVVEYGAHAETSMGSLRKGVVASIGAGLMALAGAALVYLTRGVPLLESTPAGFGLTTGDSLISSDKNRPM